MVGLGHRRLLHWGGLESVLFRNKVKWGRGWGRSGGMICCSCCCCTCGLVLSRLVVAAVEVTAMGRKMKEWWSGCDMFKMTGDVPFLLSSAVDGWLDNVGCNLTLVIRYKVNLQEQLVDPRWLGIMPAIKGDGSVRKPSVEEQWGHQSYGQFKKMVKNVMRAAFKLPSISKFENQNDLINTSRRGLNLVDNFDYVWTRPNARPKGRKLFQTAPWPFLYGGRRGRTCARAVLSKCLLPWRQSNYFRKRNLAKKSNQIKIESNEKIEFQSDWQ